MELLLPCPADIRLHETRGLATTLDALLDRLTPKPPKKAPVVTRPRKSRSRDPRFRGRNYSKSEEKQRAILRYIAGLPGASSTVYWLAWALGTSEASVRYQIGKLAATGAIVVAEEPHRGRYRLRVALAAPIVVFKAPPARSTTRSPSFPTPSSFPATPWARVATVPRAKSLPLAMSRLAACA